MGGQKSSQDWWPEQGGTIWRSHLGLSLLRSIWGSGQELIELLNTAYWDKEINSDWHLACHFRHNGSENDLLFGILRESFKIFRSQNNFNRNAQSVALQTLLWTLWWLHQITGFEMPIGFIYVRDRNSLICMQHQLYLEYRVNTHTQVLVSARNGQFAPLKQIEQQFADCCTHDSSWSSWIAHSCVSDGK